VLAGPIAVDYFDNDSLSGEPVHRDVIDSALTFWIHPVAGGRVDAARFSARMTGIFTPEVDGRHVLGVHSAGLSRVFVDDVLVADAWSGWTKGRTFFEEGCDEVTGEVMLTAGHPHRIEIEFATKAPENLVVFGVRVGISRPMGDAEIAEAAAAARQAETAVLFVGRSGEWDTEGSDLQGIALPGRQDDLIAAVCAANPRTVVVLQTGGPVEMPWLPKAAAVLQAWYPGQEAGNAIADVLYGRVDPGGRLPQTFPVRWQDNPTHSQDPEVYPGLDGKVRYEEGLMIGYRHYDRTGIHPLFPFGHGLSYTTFALSDVAAHPMDQGARLSARVTNTGSRAGSTVVQVYLGEAASPVLRPMRELKGFAKVALEPGASAEVVIDLSVRDFAWFDVKAQGWTVTGGTYTAFVGFSAADIRAEVTLQQDRRRLPV
jgi:beta-glucosidase